MFYLRKLYHTKNAQMLSTIIKNFLYNSSYQILLIFVPLFTTPYISRVLGAEKIGIYAYNYSIAYYFSIFILLGLNNYGNRNIASVKDQKHELSQNFWSMYFLQIIMGMIIFICYLFYSSLMSLNIGISLIFSIYVFSEIINVNWCFFGLEEFRIITIRNFAVKILSTLSIFLFVKDQGDLDVYCYILVLSSLISQLLLWPRLLSRIPFYLPSFSQIRRHLKPNLLLFTSVLGTSIYKYLDKIMLGSFSQMDQVGYFEQAEKIIALPVAFIVSLGTVMLPRMTNLLSKKANDKIYQLYFDRSIAFAIFLSSTLAFGIMGVSNEFVPLFYGRGNEIIILLFYILLPSCIFLGIGNVITTQYLIPQNKDGIYVKSIFCGAIVNVLCNLILIPKLGAVGASFSSLLTEFAVCCYKVYYTCKRFNILNVIKRNLIYSVYGFAVFVILVFINLPINNMFTLLFVKTGIGICTFLILFSLFERKKMILLINRFK